MMVSGSDNMLDCGGAFGYNGNQYKNKEENTMKVRKMFCAVLALCMVLTLVPVNALAAVSGTQVQQPAVQTETITHINPLYEGVITEADLVRPAGETGAVPNASSASDYAVTFEEAGAQIRAGMTQRQTTVVAYYQSDVYDSGYHTDIFDAAVAHTGVPKEGDSLRWVYGGYSVSISRYSSDGVYYMTFTYTMTYYTTAEQEAQLDTAVEELLTGLDPSGTDYEKLCTVYDYICANITYDYDNLENTDYMLKHTAYAALIDKTAVCQGYAALLYRLALEMGIDCRMITGTGNGGGHAWNIVKLNGLYYNADSTWDASWLQGVGYYNYYLQCEDTFTAGGTNHIRDAEYDTDEFHAAYPMSEADFDPDMDYVAAGTCGENVAWELSADGTLTISGSGAMDDLENNSAQPWYTYRNEITAIVVKGTVTHVGARSFRWLENVTGITLEEGVLTVGDYAMESCGNLTTLSLPESLTTLGAGALGNTGLPELVLPDGITNMGSGVCSGSEMTRVVLPANLTEIPERAFTSCLNLTEVVISDSVAVIGDSAFYNCQSLTEITFPAGVTEICSYAVRECGTLEVVRFLGDAPTIADTAFWYVTARAYYPEGNTTWTSDVMLDYGGDLLWGIEGQVVILASGTCGENITWTLDEFYHLEITGTGDMDDWETNGAPWADYSQDICSVTISDGITSIGSHAFFHNYDLASVELPDSVTRIGQSAFSDCEALCAIDLPENLVTIGDYVFWGCALTDVTFPGTLETIGHSAFKGCELTTVHIPEGVTTLGADAFYGCPLAELTVPASLTDIGARAFYYCAPLDYIQVDADNPVYCNDSQGAMYNIDRSTLIVVPAGFTGAFVIPESVSRIESSAFAYCSNMTEVTIPNTVTEMGSSVFWSCDGLTELTFPDSMTVIPSSFAACCDNLTRVYIPETVTGIEDSAFFDTGLTQINLPDGLTSMGTNVFQSCDALTAIAIPAGITVLPNSTLLGCTALTQVDLPETMTALEPHCFNGCTALTGIDLPEGLTSIGYAAFYGCTALASISIPAGVTAIENNTFNGCEALTEVNLPGGLLSMDHHAFYKCSALPSISIPAGVTAVADYTFGYCTALIDVELPDALETLGERVFWSCTGLKEIIIPAGVTGIGADCFVNAGLERITFRGNAPAFGSDYVFQNVIAAAYYPAEDATWTADVMQDYGGTISWVAYESEDLTSGTCGETAAWTLTDGLLTISGTGDMADYTSAEEQPWYDQGDSITAVLVEGTVSSVGDYAFCGLSNLASVTIEEGVTGIGGHAMENCPALSDVLIPATVTEMGENVFTGSANLTTAGPSDVIYETFNIRFGWQGFVPARAFHGMSQLTRVEMPRDTVSIGRQAFMGCSALTQIDLTMTLTSIGDMAFAESGLTEIIIPGSVTELGIEAFRDTPLVSAGFPAYVTEIPYMAFSGCDQLVSFDIPEGVTDINVYAFKGCTALTEITIPASMTHISSQAFGYCTALTEITFRGSAPRFYYDAFIGVEAVVHYPATDASWTADVMLDYEGKLTWNGYIPVVDSGYAGDVLHWELKADGTLTVSGDSEYVSLANTLKNYKDLVKYVVVEEGVTGEIGSFTDYTNLISVSIPDTITAIGDNAFSGCTALTDIVIPDSVVRIGSSAFYGCTGLTEITIPASVTEICDRPFGGCTNLTGIWVDSANPSYASDSRGVVYSKNMTTLVEAPGALEGEYVIPDSVTAISWGAFDSCTQMTSVALPDGITVLRMETFLNCSALEEITIPANVTVIESLVFGYCASLTQVTFLGDAPAAEDFNISAFESVTATVYYPAGNATWTDEIMLDYCGDLTWVPVGDTGVSTGDANGDGSVDNIDAMLVMQYTVGIIGGSDLHLDVVDVNGDGVVDNIDAMLIMQYTVGIISSFPVDA